MDAKKKLMIVCGNDGVNKFGVVREDIKAHRQTYSNLSIEIVLIV
jgi:hypothetical protein